MPIKLPSFRPRRDAYPPDLWTKCPSCEEMLFNKQLDKVRRVCPSCGHHFRLSAEARLDLLLDPGSFAERDAGLQSVDPLGFVDQKPYPDRLAAAQVATGMRDAAVWGTGHDRRPAGRDLRHGLRVHGRLDGRGRRREGHARRRGCARRAHPADRRLRVRRRPDAGGHARPDAAREDRGGARAAARRRGPVHLVLTDPTTGGVFASFAALGDINLAEPNALIGFAGARVSAGTIAQELPPGFQRAEFLFEHGFLDRVVHRSELRAEVSSSSATSAGRRATEARGRAGGARAAGVPAALVPLDPRRAGHAQRGRADQRRRHAI